MSAIFIEMTPIGKGRPRFSRVGNYVKTYTPAKTTNAENLIAYEYQNKIGTYYETEALEINICACYLPPKNISKKKYTEIINTYRTKRPDLDNIIKLVLDALNGVAYKDDNQVAKIAATKKYDVREGIAIKIKEVERN